MAVMEFANVSFRYPTSKEQVLKEVSFQVQKGEFIVLCGASGSGKTTLLKHMIKSQIPIGIGSGSILKRWMTGSRHRRSPMSARIRNTIW